MTDAVTVLEFGKTLLPFLLEYGSRAVQRRRKSQQALDNALKLALAQLDAMYPDLTASLFDETFIRYRAKALFQRYFQGSGWPNPDELASAWLAELGQVAATPNIAYAQEGAHAFLRTLEDELRKDPTFAHVFKNRLIAQLSHLEELFSSQMVPLIQVHDLRAAGFELGDHEAATFPYCIAPIQNVWDRTVKALQVAARGQGKRGLMVLGTANAGKTRLVYEALHTSLEDWTILIWHPNYGVDQIPSSIDLRHRNLVILVDDLQHYVYAAPMTVGLGRDQDLSYQVALRPGNSAVLTLRTLLARARSKAKNVCVVATCRIEDEINVRAELPSLFQELDSVALPTFSLDASNAEVKALIGEFTTAGAPHVADYDGTIGSMILGLGAKRGQYLLLRDPLSKLILRAMKLLWLAKSSGHTERRLRAICSSVFGEHAATNDPERWESALQILITHQFVTEQGSLDLDDVALRIRNESYFDQVVTDYPGREIQLERHLTALRDALRNLGDAEALSNLGVAMIARHGHLSALEVYEDALKVNPRAEMALFNMANSLYFVGRKREALQISDQLLEFGSLNAEGWSNRGVMLAEMGERERAVAAFDRALELDLQATVAAINKGTLLMTMKRDREAIASFENVLPLEANNETLLCNLGVARRRQGLLSGAREAFEQMLVVAPGSTLARVNLAAVMAQLDEEAAALALLDGIADDDPAAVQAWHNRGTILAKQGHPEAAVSAYDHALILDPRNALSLACKAGELNVLGDHIAAIAACIEATKIDPGCADGWRNLGGAYCAVHLYAKAKESLEIARVLEPNDDGTWYYKGVAHLNLSECAEAFEALNHALQLNPANDQARAALSEVQDRLGRRGACKN